MLFDTWCKSRRLLTTKHLLEQIKYKAILIFEALYSNCIAVFAFNNSSNHSAFSEDALITSRMNLGPGGKQPIIYDTFFGENYQLQSIVSQKLIQI